MVQLKYTYLDSGGHRSVFCQLQHLLDCSLCNKRHEPSGNTTSKQWHCKRRNAGPDSGGKDGANHALHAVFILYSIACSNNEQHPGISMTCK